MIFLFNLWQILTKAPQIIGIIKAIIDVIGLTQVQKILEAIREALKLEVPTQDAIPKTEAERTRLGERIRRRFFNNL